MKTTMPARGALLWATALLLSACGGEAATDDPVARGKYLVTVMLCNDCHTPWHMGPEGPRPDPERLLSGHPQDLAMTPAPDLETPWGGAFSETNTAWSGPWGVSFPANLTPDPETGLGRWTFETFRDTLRNGRHQGRGRALLPPMPWEAFGQLTDDDLRAVFAYLRSIPPIVNRVPDPVPPAAK